jgi:two-component system, NtrC family, sensor histidine kinase HydH
VTHRREDERRQRRRERSEASAEERALREARRRANRRLGFYFHLLAWASTCAFLLLVAGFRAAFVTALAWGIGLAFHAFAALVVPDLRRGMVEREVERQLAESAEERRHLEDRHARSLEELSASIAHEIRNPITAAKSLVQQMGEDPTSKETLAYASVALEELDRVERSISHLLRFAREEDLELRDVRLAEIVDSALATFGERAARLGVRIEREIDGPAPVRGDPEKLRRVVINLVGNALDALEEARVPEPSVRVLAGENLAGSEVWLRVRDNGPGIAPELRGRLFDPFTTSKRDGTGLGLALARKVVLAHGGSIEAAPAAPQGTEFVVTLPRRAGA